MSRKIVRGLFDVMENCLIRIVWCYGKLSDPYCLMLWKIVWSVCPQKHPSRGVLIKRCSENMQQIYWRKPMPEYDFKKVAFWHGCSPVNLLRNFRTPFPKNTSGQLLLCPVSNELKTFLRMYRRWRDMILGKIFSNIKCNYLWQNQNYSITPVIKTRVA